MLTNKCSNKHLVASSFFCSIRSYKTNNSTTIVQYFPFVLCSIVHWNIRNHKFHYDSLIIYQLMANASPSSGKMLDLLMSANYTGLPRSYHHNHRRFTYRVSTDFCLPRICIENQHLHIKKSRTVFHNFSIRK